MSLKRLIQQNRNASCASAAHSSHPEPINSPPLDNKRTLSFSNSTGHSLRDYKQLALSRTRSLHDSSNPQRISFKIFKEDNETFGFEFQTLSFQYQSNCSLETCTYVSKVIEGSPAHLSGLQSGFILTSIGGVSIEGLGYKQMVDLIKASGNLLRLETMNEALIMKRMELETKLRFLKQTLQEKLIEFQSLCSYEHHLLHGEMTSESLLDRIKLKESNLLGDYVGSGSALANKLRCSSESSSKSYLSSISVDSEESDSFYQACVFEDAAKGPLSQQSSTDDDCFVTRDSDAPVKNTSLRRHRSISLTSNGSRSSQWAGSNNISSIFGTLPRKNKMGSIRKKLLKFIPDLHQAVVEEDSHV